jgi:bifunctional ADP-heptose synthase (sugar kinase/adenylyltransferase)
VDTRSKILTLEAALQLAPPVTTPVTTLVTTLLTPPLTVVTGYFDGLRAEHVRDLQSARALATRVGRNDGPLLAIVLPGTAPLLNQRARAELVAALRVVDYVVTADDRDLDRILEAFPPSQLVRLEAADERRSRQLMEHVRSRQAR